MSPSFSEREPEMSGETYASRISLEKFSVSLGPERVPALERRLGPGLAAGTGEGCPVSLAFLCMGFCLDGSRLR